MKILNVLVVTVALGLSGCQSLNNRTGGNVIGGVLGGALGNQVGKGNGRIAATILGTLGGAFLGGAVPPGRAGLWEGCRPKTHSSSCRPPPRPKMHSSSPRFPPE